MTIHDLHHENNLTMGLITSIGSAQYVLIHMHGKQNKFQFERNRQIGIKESESQNVSITKIKNDCGP